MMLTKEHLKYRTRAGRVKPVFLTSVDTGAKAQAESLIGVFEGAVGQTLGDLEDAAEAASRGAVGAAFKKLLLDMCDVDAEDPTLAEKRWELLKAAQAARAEGKLPLADFQERIGAVAGADFARVKETLYGDLPACRRVRGMKTVAADALVDRYNLAQVQGLLLRAKWVTLRLKDASLGEKRELFRQIKFRRLIAGVADEGKKGLLIELSGPLGLLDQASSYAMRLASFFPSVLHLMKWELRAEVHVNSKILELRLDETSELRSHYKERTPYIPEELMAFVETFNSREREWRAEPGGDFVHIGRESYCFPDLTLQGLGRRAHVELFHRWHAGQLARRLESLEKSPLSDLLIGVSKSLAEGEAKFALEASTWFRKFGFVFAEFPTPKVIASRLEGIFGSGAGRL